MLKLARVSTNIFGSETVARSLADNPFPGSNAQESLFCTLTSTKSLDSGESTKSPRCLHGYGAQHTFKPYFLMGRHISQLSTLYTRPVYILTVSLSYESCFPRQPRLLSSCGFLFETTKKALVESMYELGVFEALVWIQMASSLLRRNQLIILATCF